MNQNALCLPELIGTMGNKYREEYAIVSYISIAYKSTISDLTKNKHTYDVRISGLPLREIDLNFGAGVVGSIL